MTTTSGSTTRIALLVAVTLTCAAAPMPVLAAGSVADTTSTQAETDFEQNTVETPAGGLARLEVDVPEGTSGTVWVGSTDKRYLAQVRFTDADDSGNVTLTVNTYLAGNGATNGQRLPWSVSDGDRLDGVTLRTPPLDETLDPAVYDVNVTVDGREAAVASLAVAEPSVGGGTTYTAPDESFGEADPQLTRTQRVAKGDVAVVRFNATSALGLLEAQDGPNTTARFRMLVASGAADFWMERTDVPDQADPAELDVGDSFGADALSVTSDRRNGTVTVQLDESALVFDDGSNPAGSEFDANFEVTDESRLGEDDLVADAPVTFTERTGSIGAAANGSLELPASANASLSGTATVAPGTALSVAVRADGLLRREQQVQVAPNRTSEARYDLSGVESGATVRATVSELDATADGTVVAPERQTNATATPATRTVRRTDGTTTDDAATTTAVTTTASQTTSGDGPGFGVVAAVVALGALVLWWRT